MRLPRMGHLAAVAALLGAAGCDSPAPTAPPTAPPTVSASPPAEELDGRSLYEHRCGMCHQGIGMAVSLLSRRPGDTSNGLLEQRKDLAVEFVTTVTRTGIGNMPRIPRGEVSDPEMKAIAIYLAKAGK